MKKYRISNMKRFMCFIMVLAVLLCSTVLFIFNLSTKSEYSIVDYSMRAVNNGDTLWSIAKEINPGKDVREVIYDIERMNGWNGTPVIHTGDVITVPVYN